MEAGIIPGSTCCSVCFQSKLHTEYQDVLFLSWFLLSFMTQISLKYCAVFLHHWTLSVSVGSYFSKHFLDSNIKSSFCIFAAVLLHVF
ncbi:hypothetical protein XENOCAPTIV_023692 [Xenoophorus captivus]|uniref:Vomeronasal type-1 receptor n=1 Tax=Xenoophorus captivus TaxID=1517983 RepID=A0ABV0RKR6_9TELE